MRKVQFVAKLGALLAILAGLSFALVVMALVNRGANNPRVISNSMILSPQPPFIPDAIGQRLRYGYWQRQDRLWRVAGGPVHANAFRAQLLRQQRPVWSDQDVSGPGRHDIRPTTIEPKTHVSELETGDSQSRARRES